MILVFFKPNPKINKLYNILQPFQSLCKWFKGQNACKQQSWHRHFSYCSCMHITVTDLMSNIIYKNIKVVRTQTEVLSYTSSLFNKNSISSSPQITKNLVPLCIHFLNHEVFQILKTRCFTTNWIKNILSIEHQQMQRLLNLLWFKKYYPQFFNRSIILRLNNNFAFINQHLNLQAKVSKISYLMVIKAKSLCHCQVNHIYPSLKAYF